MQPKNQPYRWKNVEIVGGGFITGIAFHPAQRDLLYARTDIGGAYRWDAKTRRWQPLQDWLEKKDWNLYGIESLGLDPEAPQRLYLAVGTYTNDWAGNGAILRSSDQGKTFQRTDLPFKLGGNENGRSMGERLAARGKTVYFGTRHEGLWRSDDFGAHWARVESFPVKGRTDGVGVGFVLLHGSAIYACAQTPEATLWRSLDDGKSWKPVPGQPKGLLPHHGAFDSSGTLYLTYSNGPGPNGVTDGAVWKYDTKTSVWVELTPEKPGNFGYAGLAIDPARPGTILVSSLDRWAKGDTIWRSVDGGKSWRSYKDSAQRDSSGSPFLNWGRPSADLGHWIGALALDPFRPGHVLYGTGATIWGSDNADKEPSQWTVRAQGLEETAVQDLISPPAGAPLISALGDIGGFRHDTLSVVPGPGKALSPMFNTTSALDFAEHSPNLLVAAGNAKVHGALSVDGGASWQLFPSEPLGTRGAGRIALSADGKTILWAPSGALPHRSTDKGATWLPCEGVPSGVSVASDRYEAKRLWAYDTRTGTLYESTDSGAHFTALPTRVPPGGDGVLRAPFRAPGNLWLCANGGGLWHKSVNRALEKMPRVDFARAVGFGAPKPGTRYPVVYLNGTVQGVPGVFRSEDVGTTWTRIDDDQHRFATSNVICGDPRVYGRVYLGTNGRGVLYGEPPAASSRR